MVTTRVCEQLGCANPVFGFSWWEPDVAIAVSQAGGLGIWGCTRRTPEEIEFGISRMKAELGDLPWGVDLVIPAGMPDSDDRSAIEATLPEEHVAFVEYLREKYDVPDDGLPGFRSRFVRSEQTAREQLSVVMDHRIPVLALGIGSPVWAVEAAHEQGSLIVSLVGAPTHAESAIRAGADLLVAQGTDAGGHTGPIGTFSLVPQVVEVADGVWMGTAFLASVEAQPSRSLLDKLLAAGPGDTVISRSASGKTLRMLRSAWSDEWEAPGAPTPLGMPYQDILIGDILGQILRHEVTPLVHEGAGQGVSHLTAQEPVAEIMDRLVAEADQVLADLGT